ncbi:MAG: nuclear transport factor 2 family protein [Alphaproteobacteria bacterium]|nr:MAG: nuclear transport factor 2 family protein [Alphaproteobacteria bacterium]
MGFSGPLEDRVAIRELNAAYGDAVSRRDKDDFAATWASDAIWHLPWLDPVEGRDAIVSLWLEQIANYPFHNYSGMVGQLAVTGARASGRVWTSELVENIMGKSGRVTGRYDDDYVKGDGRWYFARRVFTPLHGMDSIVGA